MNYLDILFYKYKIIFLYKKKKITVLKNDDFNDFNFYLNTN